MFSIIRALRIGQTVCRLSEQPGRTIYSRVISNLTAVIELQYQSSPFVVRPKRSFSTEDYANQDPLSECDAIYPLNSVQIEELTGNDPTEVKKLRVLQMELAVKMVQHPGSMPQRLTLEQWRNLLTFSRNGQAKYLITLKRKEGRLIKKVPVATETLSSNNKFEDSDGGIFDHRLFRNALFPMIHPNTVSAAFNSRLVEALQFGPTVVMDCGYEDIMTVREVKNLCQQLAACVNVNRTARKPYNLTFCNLKKESTMGDTFWAAMPNLFDEQFPIVTTQSCYTDIFPREKIVYLTPHCRETVEFSTDDIYVIGAMVDKSNPGPHSLIKAKAQGIRMGSFPIDRYLVWKKGTKSLTLNQVLSIMLKMHETRDWVESFKVVPKRKITDVMPSFGIDKRLRRYNF